MSTYNEVRRLAESLTPDEQLRLLEDLAVLIRQKMVSEKTLTQPVSEDSSLKSELRRQKLVEILEKVAASNVFANISDPVRWQRELRQDRPLPGRD
ncbi:MAG: hypothetical protein WA919_11285 [Coleofasciculaceae cyanobacterium]